MGQSAQDTTPDHDGSVSGTAHYQAGKHRYVVNGKVKLTNKGNQKAKNVQLRLPLQKKVLGIGHEFGCFSPE